MRFLLAECAMNPFGSQPFYEPTTASYAADDPQIKKPSGIPRRFCSGAPLVGNSVIEIRQEPQQLHLGVRPHAHLPVQRVYALALPWVQEEAWAAWATGED